MSASFSFSRPLCPLHSQNQCSILFLSCIRVRLCEVHTNFSQFAYYSPHIRLICFNVLALLVSFPSHSPSSFLEIIASGNCQQILSSSDRMCVSVYRDVEKKRIVTRDNFFSPLVRWLLQIARAMWEKLSADAHSPDQNEKEKTKHRKNTREPEHLRRINMGFGFILCHIYQCLVQFFCCKRSNRTAPNSTAHCMRWRAMRYLGAKIFDTNEPINFYICNGNGSYTQQPVAIQSTVVNSWINESYARECWQRERTARERVSVLSPKERKKNETY